MFALDVCLILYIFQMNVFPDVQREFGDSFTDVLSASGVVSWTFPPCGYV